MSLLNRIQERTQQADAAAEPGVELTAQNSSQTKVDIRSVFREPHKKEVVSPEVQRKQDKHQELKNLIHKKILQEFKDAPVDEIIPTLDGMEIGRASCRGRVYI